MKQFLLRVLLPTFIIVFTVLWGLELYLRSLPNDFKNQVAFMDKNVSDIKILVLGSSCTAMGVKPICFDWQPSFSLAYANQPIKATQLILGRYIDSMDSLRYVIIDATYAGLWSREESANTFIRKYTIYCGLDGFNAFENNFEISAGIGELSKQLTDNASWLTCDEDGFQSRFFKDIPYDDEQWKKYGRSHCEEHTLIDKDYASVAYEKNINILKNIITICKDKGVVVLFVTSPCHRYYYEWYNPRQMEIVDSTYNALCKEYDNVKWLDFTEESFNNDEFSNVNHLNQKGAIKFTRILNDSILQWN